MTTTLEGSTRTTTQRPTREPEGPVDRRRREWRLWVLLAIPFVLLAAAVAVGLTVGSDDGGPVAAVEADTYVLDGTRALPGQADGWFRAPEFAGPQVLGQAIEYSPPLPQGYEPGLPDGWYDPAGDEPPAAYPRSQVR